MTGSRLESQNTGQSVFIGENAGAVDDLTNNYNVFVGYQSGFANTSGQYGTFLGWKSGADNTTGADNTFIGMIAGANNTTGSRNTIIGSYNGIENTTGNDNTSVGYMAGYRNKTGHNNVVMGNKSAFNNGNLMGTGFSNNTVIGAQAGYKLGENDDGNIMIGYQAGYNETGSDKLYIDNSNTTTPLIYGDFSTNILTVNGDFRVGNGNRFVLPASNTTNMMNIDNSGGTFRLFREDYNASGAGANGSVLFEMANDGDFKVFNKMGLGGDPGDRALHIYGSQDAPIQIRNTNSTAGNHWIVGPDSNNAFTVYNHNGAGVYVGSGNQTWSSWSDIRLKENIHTIDNALEGVLSLRGIRYNFIGREKPEIGVVAQEVQAKFPELVSEHKGYLGVAYDGLAPILIEAIKEQQKQIEDQKEQLNSLQEQINELKALIIK